MGEPVGLTETAFQAVLGDAGLRDRLAARGRARAASFTWENVARQTLEVYDAVQPGR